MCFWKCRALAAIALVTGLLAPIHGCTRITNKNANDLSEIHSIPPSEIAPEEYAVYSVLIEKMYVKPEFDSVVIMNEPVINELEKGNLDGTLRYVSENTSANVPRDLMDNFKAKSQAGGILVNRFTVGVTCVLFSKQEVNDLYRGSGWSDFWNKYPRRGIISFSRVGFSEDQRMALVYTGTQSGGKSGRGFVILTKEADIWEIKDKVDVWVS